MPLIRGFRRPAATGLAVALALVSGACGSRDRSHEPVTPDSIAETHEGQFADEARIFVVPAAGGRPVALTGDDAERHSETEAHETAEHAESGDGDHHEHGDERQVDNPMWSPRGERIAFTQTPCEYCPPELFVMDATGSHQRPLNRVRNVFQPTWSPDGEELAVLLPGRRNAVYAYDVRGRHRRPLVTDRAAIEAPSWSPAGGRITFARQVSATNWEIYASSTRSGGLRRLTRSPAQETTPEFSPDGKRIAFTRQSARGTWALYTMRADGTRERRITSGRLSAVEPTWSPDGRRLAFTAQDLSGRSAIAVVNARGGAVSRITGAAIYASQPAWSPEGATIAFAGRALTRSADRD